MSQTHDVDPMLSSVDGRTDPDENELFELLSNQRRRFALHYLKQRGDHVELREVAEQVASWEYDKPIRALDPKERRRVQTALHQFHFPKMNDVGVIEYDARVGTAEISTYTANRDLYLDVVSGENVPWGTYYFGLSVLNGAVLGFALGDVTPFGLLPMWAVATYLVVSVAVSALVHTYSTRQRRLGSDGPPPETRVD